MAKTCVRCKVVKMWGHEVPVADRGRMCLFCRKFYCEPCLEAHKSEEEHKNNELKWVWGRDWKKVKDERANEERASSDRPTDV